MGRITIHHIRMTIAASLAIVFVIIAPEPLQAAQNGDSSKRTAGKSYTCKTCLKCNQIEVVPNEGVVTPAGTLKQETAIAMITKRATDIIGVESDDHQVTIATSQSSG